MEAELLNTLERTMQTDTQNEDEVMSVSGNSEEHTTFCKRCRKEIEEEVVQTEEIRNAIEKAHLEDKDDLDEDISKMISKPWPDSTFNKSDIKIGNPLFAKEEDEELMLVLKDGKDEEYIVKKFKERYPPLVNIIEKDLENGRVEYLENIARTKSGEVSCKRTYITRGSVPNDLYHALKELEITLKRDEKKKIGIIVADQKAREIVRKLLEIIFLQTDIVFMVYAPKKESNGKNGPRENRYEAMVVSSKNKSYSDMLKVVRQNIDPTKMGLEIRSVRKRKDESLLIVTEKGKADVLRKEIEGNANMSDIEVVEKRTEIIVSGMDAVTTEEELKAALENKLLVSNIKGLEMKSMYTNRSGEQVATLELNDDVAETLVEQGTVKIGWSVCKIKKKISIPRCSNCLKMGHLQRQCKAKRTKEKRCLKCTQEGHITTDCKNQSYCSACKREGHRSDSMSCPKYRKLVYQKGK